MSRVVSMTGFASVNGALAGGRSFTLTLKGVNHRHLDLQVRMPSGLDALEAELRKAVKAEVRRGHVELTLGLERAGAGGALELDEALLDAYVAAYRTAAARFGVTSEPDISGLLRMPGVLAVGSSAIQPAEIAPAVLDAMEDLLRRFNEARAAEGLALASELRLGMKRLAELAAEARALREGMSEVELARLRARLAELLGGAEVNEERLLMEAAVLASRGDVEEELVRLRTHIDRFCELLDLGGEVGRQLDFLLQELNREANTMLSKTGGSAGDAGLRLTEVGLAVKVELERAREQVQNLE